MVNQFEPMFFGDFTLQLLDFFVMKLGGPDAVRALRYAISESLRVK